MSKEVRDELNVLRASKKEQVSAMGSFLDYGYVIVRVTSELNVSKSIPQLTASVHNIQTKHFQLLNIKKKSCRP